MNLQEFYKSIPEKSAPKSEWIASVAKRLNVSEGSVRGWVNGGHRPRAKSLVAELSKITGIPENELF